MLRCNEPATPLISSILYTPHKFGMPDRPDAQENLDTHFHHSSPLTCARDMALLFYFFSGKRASKSEFIYLFSSSLYVSWGRRHGLASILSRCEKILWEKGVSCTMRTIPHLPTYFLLLLLQLFALWLRRYPGYMVIYFWEGASWSGRPSLFLALGGKCAELTLDCIGVGTQPPFIICDAFGT